MDSPEFGGPRWLFALILVMLIGIALAIGLGGVGRRTSQVVPGMRPATSRARCERATSPRPMPRAKRGHICWWEEVTDLVYRFQVSRPTYLLTITAMSVDENKQEHWNEVGLAEPIWLKSHTYYECGLNEDGVPYVREVE